MRACLPLLLLLGCVAPKAPQQPPPPPITTSVAGWVGTHLSGARADVAVPEQAPQEVLRIECSWMWGEGLAQLVPQELAASSRLHVAVDRSEPFLPVSNQVAATRVARDGQSSSFDVESKLRLQGAPLPSTALLPAGATVRFGADERVKQTGLAAAELHWHANGALDLAWVVPARSVDEEGVEEQYRERVLLDVQAQIDSAGLVLVLPRAVDDKLDLALRLQVKRRIGAELGEEWLAMREVLLQSGESATRGSRLPSREETFRNELVDAWQELVAPAYRRAAWLHLAGALDAQMAQDYGFLATDEDLATVAQDLHAKADAARLRAAEPASLGLAMEGHVMRHLALQGAEGKLEPQLHGLLLLHTGEVGRWPGTLDEALREARTLSALRTRFLRENESFLEDGNPAARVRAHDWLVARDLGVAGYDPLAEREVREAALAAWDEQREAKAGAQ